MIDLLKNDLINGRHMIEEVNRAAQKEENICKHLRLYFLKQRQQESVSEDKKISITEDIQYTARAVCTNSLSPVPLLKSMGIVFFGRTAAFNLSTLPSQIILCRSRTLKAFKEEGWEDVKSDQDTNLASIIGANEVKNWIVLNLPPKSSLALFLSEKPQLIAKEQDFGLDHAPDEILIGPGLPPQDVLTEPHFPLVSIQYERVLDTYEVASFKPLKSLPQNKSMSTCTLTGCSHINYDYT